MIYSLRQPLKKYIFLSRSVMQQATSNKSSLQYCVNIKYSRILMFHTGRQHDYENYLATLLMTKDFRTPALVLRAFNVEVARVQDQTTDPQTAAMRLQFWQDSVNAIFKNNNESTKVPAHPVIEELNKVCMSYKLPRRSLERLITSRFNLLKIKYFNSIEDVENYTENTVSTIYYLLLCIAGVSNIHADHVASHLGKAQGIANILRSVHISNYHKTIYLPMDVLMKHHLSQEMVLRGNDSENLRNVVFDIASRANSHLEKARSIIVPKITTQIFLPAIAVDKYLIKLQKANFNVFDKSLLHSSPTLPLNLYIKRILNKY